MLFFIKFGDSRHAQLSIYVVFHEESDFEVKNKENIKNKQISNKEKHIRFHFLSFSYVFDRYFGP